MREATIARNYAQALLSLATQAKQIDAFTRMINATADAVRESPPLQNFLAAPQVAQGAKRDVLRKAFGDSAPHTFVLFLEKLVSNRRQMLIPLIAIEYADLLDVQEGRVHAAVTVSRAAQPGDAEELSQRLSAALKKEVVAHLTVNPSILGGVIVRIGDTVMDGSVRRRLSTLKAALVGAQQ